MSPSTRLRDLCRILPEKTDAYSHASWISEGKSKEHDRGLKVKTS